LKGEIKVKKELIRMMPLFIAVVVILYLGITSRSYYTFGGEGMFAVSAGIYVVCRLIYARKRSER
jgi:hypothetical protein